MVAAWDFAAAGEALQKVRFDDPDHAARLAAQREEVKRLAGLKDRMIAAVNAADPPLKKIDMGLRGINGPIEKADPSGITAKLASGKTELHAWGDLGEKARKKLCDLTVGRDSADDWIAAGLLALAVRGRRLGREVLPAGRKTRRQRRPLLRSAGPHGFRQRPSGCSTTKEYAKAERALAAASEKYAKTPWFAAHRTDAGRGTGRRSRPVCSKAEAEEVYTQAAEAFRHEGASSI